MSNRFPILRQLAFQLLLGLAGLFVLLPLLGMLRLALDGSVKIAPTDFRLWPKEFTLAIFQKMLTHPAQSLSFLGLLRNSLLVSGSAAVASVLIGSGVAYAFARYRFPGRRVGLFVLLAGVLLPPVALMTPLFILMTAFGLRSSLAGLAVVYTAFSLPFCIWNMRSAFQAVPAELEESAFLDGATPWTAFWRLTLPLSLPALAVAGLVTFLAAYSEFAIGWIFVEHSQNVTLAMALIGTFNYSEVSWGEISALALLMSLPVILIFVVLQRYLVDQLLIGGIKD